MKFILALLLFLPNSAFSLGSRELPSDAASSAERVEYILGTVPSSTRASFAESINTFYEVTSRFAVVGDVTLELVENAFRHLIDEVEFVQASRDEKKELFGLVLRLAPVAKSDAALYAGLLQFWAPIAEESDTKYLAQLDKLDSEDANDNGARWFYKLFMVSVSGSTIGLAVLGSEYPHLIQSYAGALGAVGGAGLLTIVPPFVAKKYASIQEMKKRKLTRASVEPLFAQTVNKVVTECKNVIGDIKSN